MDHKKVYEKIIEKARSENRIRLKRNKEGYVYYENHHIIPRCLGGTDDENNRVLLTSREHFVCHKLLTYIYKGNRKIACAYHQITHGKTNKHIKTSRDYQYAIELHRNIPVTNETKEKCRSAILGKRYGEETKQKHRDFNKIFYSIEENRKKCSQPGEKNGMYGKTSPRLGTHLTKEKKEYLRNLYLGKTLEEIYGDKKAQQMRNTMSKNRKGKGNSFYGKHHSKETIEKIKIKRRKYNIPLQVIKHIKIDNKLMSFDELKIKYFEYGSSTLGRIIIGEYDKGYYEVKSK